MATFVSELRKLPSRKRNRGAKHNPLAFVAKYKSALGKSAVLALLACLLEGAGTNLFAHGDLHERIRIASEQIKEEPRNAALYLKRAELHRNHRQWAEAMADYERAFELDSNMLIVELGRGKTLLESGQFGEAKAALDRFLSKEPKHAGALITRARTLAQMNQPLAAADDFTKGIAQSSKVEPGFYTERARALAAAGKGKLKEALEGLDEGMKRLGPLITLQSLAIDLELKRDNYNGALARVDQVVAMLPRKDAWLARRAQILEQAGRHAEAREACLEALKAIEALPASRREVKAVLDAEEELRAAVKRLEEAVTTTKRNNDSATTRNTTL